MIRYCTMVEDVCIANESLKVSDQIIWHNKHVVYDNQSLFYKACCDSGLVYLGDLFMGDGFRSIENIKSQVRSKQRKCNAVFDYARLKRAIPRVWVNIVKEEFMQCTRQENELKVPFVPNKVIHVTYMSSNCLYKLIPSRTVLSNTCCLYWGKKLMLTLIGPRYSSVIFHRLEKTNC